MLESVIQRKIIKALESAGWLVIRPITLSVSGYPDLFAFKNGKAIFIEVKRPGEKLRKLQEFRKIQLQKQNFEVYAATSINDLKKFELI